MNRYFVSTTFGDGGEQSVEAWPEGQVSPLELGYERNVSWGGWVEVDGGAVAAIKAGLDLADAYFDRIYPATPPQDES